MATEEPTTAQPITEQPMTPESTTEEPTTSAETPDRTSVEPTNSSLITSDSTATGMASSTTNMVQDSSTPNDNTPLTDSTPGEVVDDRVGGGDGASVSVVAAVVLAILVVIVLTILISVLVAVVLSKKRGKTFNITHTNLSLGIANKLYGNNYIIFVLHVISLFFGVYATGKNPSVNDPTYDYVDEKFPTVGYEAAGGNIVFSGDTYHEGVLYHSVGPNASIAEGAGAHIYDDASVNLLPGNESFNHPIYEDPTLSQVYIVLLTILHSRSIGYTPRCR
jgi:hypothetical protein